MAVGLLVVALAPTAFLRACVPISCQPIRLTTIYLVDGRTATDLCRSLQNGEAPEDLADFFATSSSSRKFFAEYLDGEFDIADRDTPPQPLVDGLAAASVEAGDALLMNIVSGAATSADRKVARASTLLTALWTESPVLQRSCGALKDVIASSLGEPESEGWDGNYEYAKDEWAGLLGFAKYDAQQLERVRDALSPFMPLEAESSGADDDEEAPWWASRMGGGDA